MNWPRFTGKITTEASAVLFLPKEWRGEAFPLSASRFRSGSRRSPPLHREAEPLPGSVTHVVRTFPNADSQVSEVNNVLNRFSQMQQMMKKMGKFQKMMGRMVGLPGMPRRQRGDHC